MKNMQKVFLVLFVWLSLLSIQSGLTVINSCQELNTPGETYVLGSDLYGFDAATGACLYVNEDDITVNCNGYKIIGDYTTPGVYVDSTDGYTIFNCYISNYTINIQTMDSNNVTIRNNDLHHANTIIYAAAGSDIAINNNLIHDNLDDTYGSIYLSGIDGFEIFNNTLNDQSFGMGYIYTSYSNNGLIYGNELSYSQGIYAESGNHIYIYNNSLEYSLWGIYNYEVTTADIYSNRVDTSGGIGITIQSCDYNNVYSNDIYSTTHGGIYVFDSSAGTLLYDNYIHDTYSYGIWVDGSSDTYINNNIITGNIQYGIGLGSCTGDAIIENNRISSQFWLAGTCTGKALPCDIFLNKIACQNQMGCFWLPFPPPGECGGRAWPCDIFTTQFFCERQAHCSWDPTPVKNSYHIYIESTAAEVAGNRMSNDPSYAIVLWGADSSNVNSNRIASADTGVWISNTNSADVWGNSVQYSDYGFLVESSNSNNIFDNIVRAVDFGIRIDSLSSGNNIWNNKFVATTPAFEDLNTNIWNGSYNCDSRNIVGGLCKGGNYYSDYRGIDTNGDGIGETPYDIHGSNNQDLLPLVMKESEGRGLESMVVAREFKCPGNELVITVTQTDGTPIDGAEVQLSTSAGLVASKRTDSNGKVSFALSSSGWYYVLTMKEGYNDENRAYFISQLCPEVQGEEIQKETLPEEKPEEKKEGGVVEEEVESELGEKEEKSVPEGSSKEEVQTAQEGERPKPPLGNVILAALLALAVLVLGGGILYYILSRKPIRPPIRKK
ncbi:MAG: NosD domain-containing protein [Candidatus Anstonellales archaeon]